MRRTPIILLTALVGSIGLSGCQNLMKDPVVGAGPDAGFAKPGFQVEVDDGRLWVLREGEEKSGQHVTLIGAGPDGMTIKALDRDTALAYLAAKPGFNVEVEDGRVWVLLPDEEKSGRHATLIGAGPLKSTLRGNELETLQRYLSLQP